MASHTVPRTVDLVRPQRHDFKAEASGLAYMICEIRDRYLLAREYLGGDSELLASSIISAFEYVNGPMRELYQ